jgi:hypothetical protein
LAGSHQRQCTQISLYAGTIWQIEHLSGRPKSPRLNYSLVEDYSTQN